MFSELKNIARIAACTKARHREGKTEGEGEGLGLETGVGRL